MLRSLWRQLGQSGLGLLFPLCCADCQADLPSDAARLHLCDGCRELLLSSSAPACPQCGATLPAVASSAAGCRECRRRSWRFDEVVRLGRYRDHLKAAILRTKQPPGELLAAALAELLWELGRYRLTEWHPDVIIPIPMHWRRRLLRGTNCPDTLADCLSQRLNVPVIPELLRRQRNTRPQGPLSAAARQQNLRGAFRVPRAGSIAGARVILADDILTTGSTASEAARVLKQAGASFVAVAVIARAENP